MFTVESLIVANKFVNGKMSGGTKVLLVVVDNKSVVICELERENILLCCKVVLVCNNPEVVVEIVEISLIDIVIPS